MKFNNHKIHKNELLKRIHSFNILQTITNQFVCYTQTSFINEKKLNYQEPFKGTKIRGKDLTQDMTIVKGPSTTASDVKNIFDNYLLNIKNVDLSRKAKYANFQIRQRENYIKHLREELTMRNKLISEKIKSRQISIIDEDENYSKMTQFEGNQSYCNALEPITLSPANTKEILRKNHRIISKEVTQRLASDKKVRNGGHHPRNNLELYAIKAKRRNFRAVSTNEPTIEDETGESKSSQRIMGFPFQHSKHSYQSYGIEKNKYTVPSSTNHHNIALSISLPPY